MSAINSLEPYIDDSADFVNFVTLVEAAMDIEL